MKVKIIKTKFILSALGLLNAVIGAAQAQNAQSGQQGITDATNALSGYFDSVSNLILAIGAIVGLAGGIRVYTKWNNGDQDVTKAIMGWGGACIFLVLVGAVIKGVFGVSGGGGA